MRPLRHGDHGPAVAEIRNTLAGLGFLHGGSDAGDEWIGSDVSSIKNSTVPCVPSSNSVVCSSTA